MRRSDREIQNLAQIADIIKRCTVCRLAINDPEKGCPYIVPLNFGMTIGEAYGINSAYDENGKISLYFHGALQGKKMNLLAQDNHVAFEMDISHELETNVQTGNCTMVYESVMGYGRVVMLDEEEKYNALCVLMAHYHREDFAFAKNVIPRTAVYRLDVETVSGKARKTQKK